MRFLSTRGGSAVSAAEAIQNGISPNGGLYVPETYPAVAFDASRSYCETALAVMRAYLTETDPNKLAAMIQTAYRSFDTDAVAPVRTFGKNEFVCELWHGPTMAFKDVALQMLPHLMRDALSQTGADKGVYILVATSGDTGKAALEGFRDVAGTRVLVFYPEDGVSEAQRLQMVTQEGANVDVCAVRGNFDDAQTGVKAIFTAEDMRARLSQAGWRLSSANSINFGRLLPQIVYYYTSYESLVRSGAIQAGEPINFCVPTGNFGDILAGEYARRMGLPIRKLIAASNRNNVLTDFFTTGVYDDRRPFYRSMSCSIDILISSNLERLLFELADRDEGNVRDWMAALKTDGRYEIGRARLEKLNAGFDAGWCDEKETLSTIRSTYETSGMLIDPHTAVGQSVYEAYRTRTGDETTTVLLSTANPYKFATHVLGALEVAGDDDFRNVERLHELTKAPVPRGVSELIGKPALHRDVCDIEQMRARVLSPVNA